jgi:hypothetical protein
LFISGYTEFLEATFDSGRAHLEALEWGEGGGKRRAVGAGWERMMGMMGRWGMRDGWERQGGAGWGMKGMGKGRREGLRTALGGGLEVLRKLV